MHIIVNTQANSGKGYTKWQAVKQALVNQALAHKAIETQSVAASELAIKTAVAEGESCFVAAGGDGCIHTVLNQLITTVGLDALGNYQLGAIGLGSSNDFHKPLDKTSMIANCPMLINNEKLKKVDIGHAKMTTIEGEEFERYFILNGSVGFIAEGNAFFNSANNMLNVLKRIHVEVAIIYTLINDIITFKSAQFVLQSADYKLSQRFSSISILNKKHFAGGMYYDTPITMDDGFFDINYWDDMSRIEIIKTLAKLYQGKFLGRLKTGHFRAKNITLSADNIFNLELDGEIYQCQHVELTIKPKVLNLCQ